MFFTDVRFGPLWGLNRTSRELRNERRTFEGRLAGLFRARTGHSRVEKPQTGSRNRAAAARSNNSTIIKVTRVRQELWVSPETARSRIAPNAKPTTPRAENKKTCQPFSRVRSGSLKNSVSSLLIEITGNSCAKLAQKHQMAPLCLAAGTVHQSSAAPASQNTSTQRRTTKVWEPMP